MCLGHRSSVVHLAAWFPLVEVSSSHAFLQDCAPVLQGTRMLQAFKRVTPEFMCVQWVHVHADNMSVRMQRVR